MTTFAGVDVTGVTLNYIGPGLWYTASDGSWTAQVQGVIPGLEPRIPASVGADFGVPTTNYITGPPTLPTPPVLPEGYKLSVQWLIAYRLPDTVVASTAGVTGPNDAGGVLTFATSPLAPVSGRQLISAGPPLRWFTQGVAYFTALNPLAQTVTIQSLIFTLDWFVQWNTYTVSTTVPPAITPTSPPPVVNPVIVPPPSQVTIQNRIRLEKENPGYIVRWQRQERFPSIGAVTLGQRGNLTIPMAGFATRGHIVTGVEIDITAEIDPVVQHFDAWYTLEKIPGTLLPGAGTSSSGQDAAGTGAEVGIYFLWDPNPEWAIGVWG